MVGLHQLIRTPRRLTYLIRQNRHVFISIGEGAAAILIGRNLLHSGSFLERTIGNASNLSDFTLFIRAGML